MRCPPRRLRAVPLLAALAAAACTAVEDPTPLPVVLTGAVDKGPFVLGSSLSISPVDALANPTGQVFNSQTSNDLGEFSVTFDHVGLVAIEADGFYYNEVTGELSLAPITLRALHEISDSGAQQAYVNLITHLAHDRIVALVRAGAAFGPAVAQAEGELRLALGVGPSGFDPGAAGIQMNLLGGDSDANAYLLAVSSVIAQAAALRGGSVDGELQSLVNTLSVDLADDGAIGEAAAGELRAAQAALDPDRVMALLAARLAETGASAEVPDINRIIDSDLDGVPNAADNCRAVANGDQAEGDGDELGDACDCGSGTLDPGEACDDGNGDAGDGCRPDCTVEACGDELVDPGEACDDGNGASGDGCRGDCGKVELCGDQVVDDGEACDDGDLVDADGCEADCSLPACGNGIVDPGEVCYGRKSYQAGTGADGLALGDLDGDLELDVVTANPAGGSVSVLLGAGAGTLGGPTDYPTGAQPEALVLADLDGDGDLDIATADAGDDTVSVLLGAGDGTLGAATGFPVGDVPVALAGGDLDGDGDLDLVTADLVGDDLSLLLGNGDGTFAAATSLSPGASPDQPKTVAVADVDRDGDLDLVATALTASSPSIVVLLGDGAGTFSTSTTLAVLSQASTLLVGDLTGDGAPDLLIDDGGFASVSLAINDGAGLFGAPFVVALAASGTLGGLATGDFDLDGEADLAATLPADGAVRLLRGDGLGGFAPYATVSTPNPGRLSAGELSGDGVVDLIATGGSGNTVTELIANDF